MPFKYAAEMYCDYLGAARAYMGKDFTFEKEYNWWINIKGPTVKAMHPIIYEFITISLLNTADRNKVLNKHSLKDVYRMSETCYVDTDAV